MKSELFGKKLIIYAEGRITSDNVSDVQEEFIGICKANEYENLEFNLNKLEYISSAGLRMLLKIKKLEKSFVLTEVNNEVYDIFETTGFSSILDIQRVMREVSIDGCKMIGDGFYSEVYRLDPEKIIKVYVNNTTLDDIKRELDLAKQAFLKGVPTAISYDVVKVNDKYGVVFEMISSGSLKNAILNAPDKLDYYIKMYADLVRTINATEVGDFVLPKAREKYISKLDDIKDYISKEDYGKILSMLSQVPDDSTYCHGDCHIKNIMIGDGDLLLIDMDTLSSGSVLFEFAGMYTAYCGYPLFDHNNIMEFFGVEYELVQRIYSGVTRLYFEGITDEAYERNCDRIMLTSYIDMIRRMKVIYNDEDRMAKYYDELKKVLSRVDTLIFE